MTTVPTIWNEFRGLATRLPLESRTAVNVCDCELSGFAVTGDSMNAPPVVVPLVSRNGTLESVNTPVCVA